MKINSELNFLKSQCKKLKMSKRNRHVYFKNVREDLQKDNPFEDWGFTSLAVQVNYDSSTVGCNSGYSYGRLPSLSQIEGSFE